jgi:hypothetical protein
VWHTSYVEIGYLRFLHSTAGLISLDGSSNGSGATLTVNCSGGTVSSVTVNTAGSSYPTSNPWYGGIWGGGISGAMITVNPNGSGGIGSVTVNAGGTGCTTGQTYASADMRTNNIWVHDNAAGQVLPGSAGANVLGISTNRNSNTVIERNWVWGYGSRYPVGLYSGVNNVIRENVTRYDGAPNGQPKAGVVLYDEDGSIAENNITVDFDNGTDTGGDVHAALFTTSSVTNGSYPYGLGTVAWYGNIAINTSTAGNGGFYLDSHASMASTPSGGTPSTFTAKDNIVAGVSTSTTAGMWMSADTAASTNGGQHAITLDHNTIYASNGNGLRLDAYSYTSVALTNIIVDGGPYTSAGCYNKQWSGTPTASNNLWWNCNNSLYTAMPSATNADPAFVWLENITSGPAYTTGSGGTNIGATVVNQYQNGTLTGTALWPFPNDSLIVNDFCLGPDTAGAGTCEAAGNTSCTIYTRTHNTTGLCASGKSLTKYVWEQLGNPSPY